MQREVEAERFLLREPNDGRVRAVLETVPPRPQSDGAEARVVRLSLLSASGAPKLVVEVDEMGEPRVFVGPPDDGTTVVVESNTIDLWHGGNIVASLRSRRDRR